MFVSLGAALLVGAAPFSALRADGESTPAVAEIETALAAGRLASALALAADRHERLSGACAGCPATLEAARWHLAALVESGYALRPATLALAESLTAAAAPLEAGHSLLRAESWRLLGQVRRDRGEYDEALRAADVALQSIDGAALPPDVAAELMLDAAEAEIRSDRQAAAGARLEAVRGLAIDVSSHARFQEMEAFFLLREGRFAESLPAYERALALRREAGRWPSRLPGLLSGLGDAHWVLGDPWAAQAHYQEAVEAGRAIMGPDHPWLIRPLGRWASAQAQVGDMGRALQLHQEATTRAVSILGSPHPETLARLNDFANAREGSGDLAGAGELYRSALATLEAGGRNRSDHAATLHLNLALVLVRSGQPEEAREHLRQCEATWRALFGERHPFLAHARQAWGNALLALGRAREAEAAFAAALALREQLGGPRGAEVGASLLGLADARFRLGLSREALTAIDRALPTLDETLLSSRLERSRAFALRARVLAARPGSSQPALADAVTAARLRAAHLRQTLRYLGERQALRVAAEESDSRDLALSLVSGLPGSRETVFDLVIRTRALVLDELAARSRVPGPLEDGPTAALATSIQSFRRRLANLVYTGRGSPEYVQTTAERLEAMEAELARRRPNSASSGAPDVGLAEVRERLRGDDVLVAFVCFRPARAPAGRYGAFALRKTGPPAFVDLGSEPQVNEAIAAWRSQVSDRLALLDEPEGSFRAIAAAGDRLRRRIWDPLGLQGARRVFVVPDGDLAFVNIGALPRPAGGFLVENATLIHALTAERDLAIDPAPNSNSGLLALGAASFDASPTDVALRMGNGGRPQRAQEETEPAAVRVALRGGCGSAPGLRFGPLPESGAEIDEVSAAWRLRRAPEPLRVLKGLDAGEGALKRYAPGARIIHVASHGFVVGTPCTDEPEGTDPLLLSGLALAGANRRAQVEGEDDDGIVTARELAGLDLRGVEWMVLSACETGLGRPRAGEGVLGLRRAIAMAGVRSLIMTLWPVDDLEARRFVGALYEERLVRGNGTAEAVRGASLALLAELRRAGHPPHPALWAAFVAAGDWR